MKYLIFTLLILLTLALLLYTKKSSHRIAKILEASGISYCKKSDTLVVANDEGNYYEINTAGVILSEKKLGNYDLEGVVCRGDHYLFVVEDEGLLFVDRKNGSSQKVTFEDTSLSQEYILFDKKGGIEGIAQAGDLLYLARQSKKKKDSFIAVVQIDQFHAKIIEIIQPNIPDIAGLTIHNGSLYMVSDKKDLLIEYDLVQKKILREIKLPQAAQEGIAFDGKGFVYIADDNGYILKFSEKELGL